MTNQPLAVTARCRDNDRCLFEGKDLFIDIAIVNTHSEEIGFPLAYVRKTGPVVRLIDGRSKSETYLKKNLARHELRDEFTNIPPGGSVTMEWVITSTEIEDFASRPIDISAEITVMAQIRSGGKTVDYRGSATLRIRRKEQD
jgi:hypothetical protein